MFKVVATTGVLVVANVARAVIVYGDPTDAAETGRRTSVPTGAAGMGWTLQGTFGSYLGTPIAADWFVTAAHFGNAAGSITTTDGVVHPVTATVAVTGTDLVLRRVSVPFANVASIYDPSVDIVSDPTIYVYGRGTTRGGVRSVNGTSRGWDWGTSDTARSYGTNTIKQIDTIGQSNIDGGSPFAIGAQFLVADFDANAGATEATLSNGDSGGAVFVQTTGGLKLAGINYGVTLYGPSATGPTLNAAVYDATGLFESQGNGVYTPVATGDVQQTWYASYLPGSAAAIAAIVPEPATLGVILGGGLLLRRKRSWPRDREDTEKTKDELSGPSIEWHTTAGHPAPGSNT